MTAPDAPATPKPKGSTSGLSKPVMGVPLWGWFGIVVVVGGGIYLLRARGGKPEAPVVDPLPAPPAPTVGNMPMTSEATEVRILTNNQWATAAKKWLIQHGYDATDSEDAIQNYINNEKLTAGQNDLIEAALIAIGPLPDTREGAAQRVSPLRTPKDGNLLGQLLYGIADFAQLDEPGNPFSPFLLPFINNFIDGGPIGGVFQSANDLLGGNVSLSGSTPSVYIPGLGEVSLGGSVSNNGVNVSGSIPGGGSVGVGVGPSSHDTYLAPYIVKSGDTLSSISKKVYGSTGGEQLIYSANLSKIPNPSKLAVGVVLQIPAPNSNA
ncbi:LysM peptidoglycan-binding domain-containing protein [Nocardia sp. NPDC001965]